MSPPEAVGSFLRGREGGPGRDLDAFRGRSNRRRMRMVGSAPFSLKIPTENISVILIFLSDRAGSMWYF